MGLEARCQITWNGESRTTAVHLDSAVVEVRGRPALKLPFASVRRTSVRAGELVLEAEQGTLVLSLGDAASAWAAKITNPPSRVKKLGLAPGTRVRIIGVTDDALEGEVLAAGAEMVSARTRADLVFYSVEAPPDLERLAALRANIEPAGAIWVVRTKGKNASVKEAEVMAAARSAGLVDVKVVAFSETKSADKLVIPKTDRPPAKAKPSAKPATKKRSPRPVRSTSKGRAPSRMRTNA